VRPITNLVIYEEDLSRINVPWSPTEGLCAP